LRAEEWFQIFSPNISIDGSMGFYLTLVVTLTNAYLFFIVFFFYKKALIKSENNKKVPR
jgi:hypothetical protein